MTVQDVSDAYIRHKGLVLKPGNDGCITLMVPLLIMDDAYQIYNKYIKPIESRREMKMLKSKWMKCYHNFNMDYFRAFDQEQTDFVIDMMDDFERYIEHDLTVAFDQCTNLVGHEQDIERQKVLAAGIIIDILCQYAEIFWNGVYPYHNINLQGCRKAILAWTDLFHGYNAPIINPNDDEVLCEAVDTLSRRHVHFLIEYKNEEQ